MADESDTGRKDARLPERAARGNEERPERVPTAGHEGATPVDERLWEKHDRRKDTADGLVDESGLVE